MADVSEWDGPAVLNTFPVARLKTSIGDGCRELLQLGWRAMLAVHHHDTDGLAVRRGRERERADNEVNEFSNQPFLHLRGATFAKRTRIPCLVPRQPQ
jgi:hypothetical protein